MTNFLSEIVKRCCKIYFRGIDPNSIRFYFTPKSRKFSGKRRLMGIWKVKNGVTTIQVDRKFSEDADESSLTAKIAHELAHVKLKHKDFSLENEISAEKEVKKFFEKWIRS